MSLTTRDKATGSSASGKPKRRRPLRISCAETSPDPSSSASSYWSLFWSSPELHDGIENGLPPCCVFMTRTTLVSVEGQTRQIRLSPSKRNRARRLDIESSSVASACNFRALNIRLSSVPSSLLYQTHTPRLYWYHCMAAQHALSMDRATARLSRDISTASLHTRISHKAHEWPHAYKKMYYRSA